MKNSTLSYEEYLENLPPERRSEVGRVWRTVRDNMPAGYREEITDKFLTFKVGDEWYVALANQKNYISLYLMPVYSDPDLKAKLERNVVRAKCGKSCVNFQKAEDLPLSIVGEIVAANDAAAYAAKVSAAKKK